MHIWANNFIIISSTFFYWSAFLLTVVHIFLILGMLDNFWLGIWRSWILLYSFKEYRIWFWHMVQLLGIVLILSNFPLIFPRTGQISLYSSVYFSIPARWYPSKDSLHLGHGHEELCMHSGCRKVKSSPHPPPRAEWRGKGSLCRFFLHSPQPLLVTPSFLEFSPPIAATKLESLSPWPRDSEELLEPGSACCTVAWKFPRADYRVPFLSFPPRRGSNPVMPVVQWQKTVISYILTAFLVLMVREILRQSIFFGQKQKNGYFFFFPIISNFCPPSCWIWVECPDSHLVMGLISFY